MRYCFTFLSDSRTSTASTIKPLSENSLAMSSTSSASASQYWHQVVQNSNSTTFPFTEALLNWSPAVVLARKRGAGWPVSSAATAQIVISVSATGTKRRRVSSGAAMGRNISTPERAFEKYGRIALWSFVRTLSSLIEREQGDLPSRVKA